MDKTNPHEIIAISYDFQEVLQEKYYILTRFCRQKVGITEREVNGHDETCPSCESEKAAKVMSKESLSMDKKHGRNVLTLKGLYTTSNTLY